MKSNAQKIVARFRAAPFLVSFVYLAQVAFVAVLPDGSAGIVTQIVCTCPALCALIYWAGKPLGYCWAWKIECFLPCLPDVAFIANHYGWYTRPWLWVGTTFLVIAGSIVNGYRVYFKD